MEGTKEEPGVNYIAVKELFNKIHEYEVQWKRSGRDKTLQKYTVEMSVVEIYNEIPRDLLLCETNNSVSSINDIYNKLEIRMKEDGTTYIPGQTTIQVMNVDQVRELLEKRAFLNRSIGTTNQNTKSSRSHCIVIFTVLRENQINNEAFKGKLVLIDLAGSERVEKSGAKGQTMKEAQNINKSLSCLNDVIIALQNHEKYIPYRNSKLTFLLQDCIGGNSKCLFFCNISPTSSNQNETICSLRFAIRARSTQLGKARKNHIITTPSVLSNSVTTTTTASNADTATTSTTNNNKLQQQIVELQEQLHLRDMEITSLRQRIQQEKHSTLQTPRHNRFLRQNISTPSSNRLSLTSNGTLANILYRGPSLNEIREEPEESNGVQQEEENVIQTSGIQLFQGGYSTPSRIQPKRLDNAMMVDAETDEKTISLNDTTTSTQRGGVNISQYSRKGSLSTDRSQIKKPSNIYKPNKDMNLISNNHTRHTHIPSNSTIPYSIRTNTSSIHTTLKKPRIQRTSPTTLRNSIRRDP